MPDVIDREQFRKIVADQLEVDLEKVTDEARFTDDLEADSLDLVELIMAFEETYHTEISDADAESIGTVSEAWTYLQQRVAEVKV
jgi:acyl carrier protein